MNISPFLTQSATYEEYLGKDEWNAPRFAPPRTIRVRKSRKHKFIRHNEKMTKVDVTSFLTEETSLKLEDKLDGERLLAVEDYVDLGGAVIGTKAYPRPPIGFTP